MIHQHFKLVDVLTAAEKHHSGPSGKLRLDMREVEREIRSLTEKYGFEIDPHEKIYEMSVSQKQTVEIVKMLYRGANILILDEPTAVLTPQETTGCSRCCATCAIRGIPSSSSPTSSTRF